ncbi:MAG TPA: carboxypeptidase-like regulatory domain-containing protein [Bryobacteraceae bacterium]|nr:carboxypeptidase-like regulatory domain-containing protein [Bryobacteraceae bacterium]
MWRLPACALLALAAAAQPATITGRVFDVYHRPVRSARVATMTRKTVGGTEQIVAGAQATVDDAGMYRLALPAGRYVLAVLPPPGEMDFATVFPAYFYDTVEFAKAQPVEVRAGEIRPFTDFLLLEVESHRAAGRVSGASSDGITVALHSASGYMGPLCVTTTDRQGWFRFEHLAAGSYDLTAFGAGKSGKVHVDLTAPEVSGIQIHLRPAAR